MDKGWMKLRSSSKNVSQILTQQIMPDIRRNNVLTHLKDSGAMTTFAALLP